MNAKSPVLEGFEDLEIKVAEGQVEYNTLAALHVCPANATRSELATLEIKGAEHGLLLTRFEPTDEERAAIARGGDVFLWLWTFGNPVQPVALQVGPPEGMKRVPLEEIPESKEPPLLKSSKIS